ncbi:hypothetical protein H6G65_18805 [Microcystis elabens FACHB-917]|nr:hypothetical protein [Microcystis elabens FACHB-917]
MTVSDEMCPSVRGAVYEALLSFRGFFAEVDLYEVQPAPKKAKAAASDDDDAFDGSDDDDDSPKASGQQHDELEVGHFVTAEQLKAYKAEEIVPDPATGQPKKYEKGSFIYRLAGRDRQKSASYYTPEVLTSCQIKYTLKEALVGKSAADILQLKLLEMAMGSAAYLNELVNQLAQAYLERRQQETGKSIPHERFQQELQKVKMRLADQNVFGVDLNPVAVELAEVSLWLNSIFAPEQGRAFVPWFSQQLVCGNSLIGARRQIVRVSQLPTSTGRKAKPRRLWHEQAAEELAWDAELPADAIFHFLLPDPGMAAYSDKVIKELEPEAIERCKRWNKAFVGEAFTEAQIAHLLRLSRRVDALWQEWAQQQTTLRQRTTDPLPVWEDPSGTEDGAWTPLRLKDRIQEQEVLGRNVRNTNARLRLKWAMDYWCALWFWPIHQAGSLPSRDAWLLELSMILGDLEQGITPELGQQSLFADTQPKQLAVDFSDKHGYVDVQKLKAEFERLRQVEAVTERIRPLHWDLEFADLLAGGGFDLIVGNPPWITASWDEIGCLGELDPKIIFRAKTKSQVKACAAQILVESDARRLYIQEYEDASCSQVYLGSKHNFPIGSGQKKTNLYKCFLEAAFRMSRPQTIIGLLHPESVYEDLAAEQLRHSAYQRIALHLQYQNALKLFPEIHDQLKYSVNIYRGTASEVDFSSISNLYSPRTVDECFAESSNVSSGIKNEDGTWNIKGSPDRIFRVNKKVLETVAGLFGSGTTGNMAPRLPSIFVSRLWDVIRKLSKYPMRLGSLSGSESFYQLDESKCIREELISLESRFPEVDDLRFWLGSQICNSNPLAKTPDRRCTSNNHFSVVDLTQIPDDYRPRSKFRTLELNEIKRRSNTYANLISNKAPHYVIAFKRIKADVLRKLSFVALCGTGRHP